MVDFARIQDRIYYGYGKAASKLGTQFNIYRALTAINPIDNSNLAGTILGSASTDFKYTKSNKYGNAVWNFLADGRQLQQMDYLVGYQTFFIASMEPLLPIVAVECNRTVTFTRPTEPAGVGYVGYSGYTPETATLLMQNIPCSMLMEKRWESSKVNLPTSVKLPYYMVLLPRLGNVELSVGDFIQDDLQNRFAILMAEYTEFGWRLIAGTEET